MDSSHRAKLREDFLDACNSNPELKPLIYLLDLAEDGMIDNTKLFSFLWTFIQKEPELKEAYDKGGVSKATNDAAAVFVSEHPVDLPGWQFL
jgi:hypothetical protein